MVAEMTAITPLLDVQDLHVSFDLSPNGTLHAVQGITFKLLPGEKMGLVGESGCGKTTAMLALMGLLPPTATLSGSVRLGGEDLLAKGEESVMPHRWRDIAMVFQSSMNAFNPVQTIGSQIREPMELHGTATGRSARDRVHELLELVGITGSRADRYPHEFSGGMRQRAAIAMALACDPKVLLADEPTTALDAMAQAQVLELLDRVSSERDIAVILVTHDLPVVSQLCDRMAVMYAGRIVEQGPVRELYNHPLHPYTRLLYEAMPDLSGRAMATIPGEPPRLDHEVHGCPFAPRCPFAFDRCISEEPQLIVIQAGHRAACHLNAPAGMPSQPIEGPR